MRKGLEADLEDDAWNQREMIWRFLKTKTTGEAKKVVTSASHRNGREAWRKLHLQFEPALAMREALVMASFTNMVSRRAETPQEAKALLLELDERAKRVEEVTGEAIENRHRMSVVMGVLDSEAMKHTAAFQGAKQRADVLQRKVIEFANLVNASSKTMDAMDHGRHGHWQGLRKEVLGRCVGRAVGRRAVGRSVGRGCAFICSGHKVPQVRRCGPLRDGAPKQSSDWRHGRRQERKERRREPRKRKRREVWRQVWQGRWGIW